MNLKPQVTLSETGCSLLEGKTFDVPGIPAFAVPDGFLSNEIGALIESQSEGVTATLSIAQDMSTASGDWDINVSISAQGPSILNGGSLGPWTLSQKLPAALDALLNDVKGVGGIPSQTVTAKLSWVSA